MRCPSCKNKLLRKSGDATLLRTKGPLVFDEAGACRTRCFFCNTDVAVPVTLPQDAQPAQNAPEVFLLRSHAKNP